ncbi:MAG: 3-dehydroquinate synthase II [Candidatus Bathyarchaeota archaeon]|uniref:3-dehydroquinate synthase II n=1 Tax=Candidatus Bathycorpusculum sp. TaxID=2994959 RepID=UPI00281B4E62|nr:3-dehydroquinate synthase II [Candidatus Termiticorpusculum sp.]MCL2256754.1 3-dehydroquinate synthase II [Candidatus Termiticorpusculum sp.]MCL2293051.1 3-dehydroquinate synthase II [Candidatus Termiticorpusculum sp.]
MKELWIENSKQNLPANLIEQYGNVIVKENKAVFTTLKQEQTIMSLSTLDFNTLDVKDKILRICISDKTTENLIVEATKRGASYILISTVNWRVIPLENLIARIKGKSKLIAEVANAEEARVALETLEIGTDGVLLKVDQEEELLKTVAIVKPEALKLELSVAKIVSTKPIGNGARVCVDTCDLMTQGEGMLVGSQSAGLFLVEAEVNENPYVASRPFRVNAGSLSMYTLGNLQTTRYLQEFKAGDEVVIVNREGKIRSGNVGRVKIEIRPLILIEAQSGEKLFKTILQNAETIRVVTVKGSKPVTELESGDEVLIHRFTVKGGRHFGVSVPDELVIEK